MLRHNKHMYSLYFGSLCKTAFPMAYFTCIVTTVIQFIVWTWFITGINIYQMIIRYWVDNFRNKTNLTFDHVTWKSIRIIYFLGTSIIPRLATFKQRGQKIISAWSTDRPTDRSCAFFSRGTQQLIHVIIIFSKY